MGLGGGGGGRTKWKMVRHLVLKEDNQFICIHETKREHISLELCVAL